MCPQHHCDDLKIQQHSPRAVTTELGEGNQDRLYHYDVSLNGSVEVEIVCDLAAKLDENYCFDGVAEGVTRQECIAAAAITTDAATSARHRKSSSLTSFPSHLPFPLLEEKVEDTSSYRLRQMEEQNDARRTQQVMEGLHRMNVEDSEAEERLAAAASAGIDSILTAMRLHKENVRVQRYGCGVLQKLACQSDTNRALIVEAGATADIISAMKIHLARASVQECGCSALTSLAKVARGSALISQHDGIEAILEGMRLHGQHAAVQKHACLALLSLACSDTDRNSQIANIGGIETIMSAISRHSEDSGIREYGSAGLWSLAYMNTKNKAAIEAAGGLDAIFDILNYDHQELSCKSSEDHCMQLIKKQENAESNAQTQPWAKRGGVDDIMSVFVRPLQ